MSVDTMNALGVLLQGIGTLVGAVAVIVASYIGANTFAKWRRQKVAERRFEHAERIAIASYNVRRQLRYIRHGYLSDYELYAAEQRLLSAKVQLPLGGELRKRQIIVEVYTHRLEAAKNELSDLQACVPIARAVFGPELEEALEKLGLQFNKIRAHLDIKAIFDPTNDDTGFAKEIQATLTSGFKIAGFNEMDDLIAEQSRIVEGICLPILREGK